MEIQDKYELRVKKYSLLEKKQLETIKFYSALRLLIFLAVSIFSYILYKKNQYIILFSLDFIFLVLFIGLAYVHSKLIERNRKVNFLKKINERAIDVLKGKWREFEDKGEEYINKDHAYGADLDIFGKNSLFQWINSTVTPLGRKRLSDVLNGDINFDIDAIKQRQEAIKELSQRLNWRQGFIAEGLMVKDYMRDPIELLNWTKKKDEFFTSKIFKLIVTLIPLGAITSIVLLFVFKVIPIYVMELFLLVNVVILQWGKSKRNEALNAIYQYKTNIRIYENMLYKIEKSKFGSKYLNDLKTKYLGKSKHECSKQIKALTKIVEKMSDRRNAIYIVLNIITLRDYHLIYSLENWKKNYGNNIELWLEGITHFEELISLANVNGNNPNWCIPEIMEDDVYVKAKAMAHPLIGQRAVKNNLWIDKNKSIMLVTGSNMSGKSTLLRTIGINLVLAYIGTAVFADSFKTSIMKIYTCMRTGDDLEQNISSFYAEILRVKKLIDGTKVGYPIFFLLDEIFKGTNSKDRHAGAEILINQLSKENALGLVSTHDLELCDIEKKNSKVINYHFREYYKNNEIYFDYKLRMGSSTTQNALYLMQMAGIDIKSYNGEKI
ncbi:MutS-related protein [Desnuesiella massiliensis]|uniref:MutS-related protein n=1 Tax=Desnuesiella massiliensis TaxID=1650662 RepID=UPI0006E157BB|nr:MutS family DNA mismatch repair protein [Desnuesiella massiliensis]